MENAYLGSWWRASKYEKHRHHIRPSVDSSLERYDPWAEYDRETQNQRGGGMLSAPYLSLIDLIDARQHAGWERGRSYGDPNAGSVLRWCSRYGLLGMFFLEVRQVTLYPRWELRGGNPKPVATLRQYIMKPRKWEERSIGSSILEANLPPLPDENKSIGSLVPRRSWDKGWEPEAILREPVSGIFCRTAVGDVFQSFFPSVPKSERETYNYPPPMSRAFWQSYSEDENQFFRVANGFADAVRTIGQARSSDLTDAEIGQACEHLESLAASVNAGLFVRKDRTLGHQWVAGSLVASFAMMALLDAANGWLNTCSNCSRVFVSTAGRARYCSARCRKTALQRNYRDRKEKRDGETRTT